MDENKAPWGSIPLPINAWDTDTPDDAKGNAQIAERLGAEQVLFDFVPASVGRIGEITMEPTPSEIPSGEPKLTLEEAQAVIATKTAPKVTKESIEAKIQVIDYLMGYGQLTICIIKMFNGFMVHGVSAPASPANYDADVGKRYAYDNAFKQLWQLEGYLLREKLSLGGE